jgi:hypothetical protein
MTVRRGDDGLIVLDGACPVEDAEPLLQLLQTMPAAKVDWRQCGRLHTAVLQLVLASGRAAIGPCGDASVERWLVPKLPQNEARAGWD